MNLGDILNDNPLLCAKKIIVPKHDGTTSSKRITDNTSDNSTVFFQKISLTA